MSLAAVDASVRLAPSDVLRRQLFVGIIAAIVAGALSIAQILTDRPGAVAVGLTASNLFEFACTLAQFVALWAYIGVAREAGSPGLKKSSQCLIGLLLVGELYTLADARIMTPVGQAVVWAAIVLGMVGLIAAVMWPLFASDEAVPTETAPPGSAPEETAERSMGAKILAGATLVAFFALKLAAKFLGKKAVKGMAQWQADTFEMIAVGVLFLLGVSFVTWFLVSKMRLRQRLGTIVAVAAWLEALSLLSLFGVMIWLIVGAIVAVTPEMNDKAIDDLFAARFGLLTGPAIAVTSIWTILTVVVFRAVRGR